MPLFEEYSEVTPYLLVVDDEPTNLILLKQALKGIGEIYAAENGEVALALVKEREFDLILLDISMPGLSGIDVCKILKREPATADIPVIFISANDPSEYEHVSLESGGLDFISKPIDLRICRLRALNQLVLRQQSKNLMTAKKELLQLVSQVPEFISYWDEEWNNLFCNDFTGRWFGKPSALIKGKSLDEVIPAGLPDYIRKEASFVKTGVFHDFELRIEHSNQYYSASLSKVEIEDGVRGFLLTVVDISNIKRAEHHLFNEKERLKVTLMSIGDGVIATDTAGIVTFLNPVAEALTGWPIQNALSKPIEEVMQLKSTGNAHSIENPIRMAIAKRKTVTMPLNSEIINKSGGRYGVEDSAAPILDSHRKLIGAVIVFRDMTETMALLERMSNIAHHDQLTGLPNRILLNERLKQLCDWSYSAESNRRSEHAFPNVAVYLLDIDKFKYLNDTVGHSIGDLIIQRLSHRIASTIPTGSTLARIGGDEFVLVHPNFKGYDDVNMVTERIRRCMQIPFTVDGQYYNVTTSIGVSLCPQDTRDSETLIRYAETAMYRAKKDGRNNYYYFSEELENQLLERNQIEKTLRDALEKDRVEVFYQPKVVLDQEQLIGFEALCRIRKKDGSLMPPNLFIPIAEETGLIVPLGLKVLKKSCLMAKKLCDLHLNFKVAVNLAGAQLAELNIVQDIQNALNEHHLDPQLLELEVTESMLMHDVEEVCDTIHRISQLGVTVAIDDFGTGYSSLLHLNKFELDVLKIDKSFIDDMLNDKKNENIVNAIISLSKSLGMKVVAEGVESIEQKNRLIELGCDIVQGYYYSKPLPEEETLSFITAFQGGESSTAMSPG